MNNFKVGDNVICIDSKKTRTQLVKGKSYMIKNMRRPFLFFNNCYGGWNYLRFKKGEIDWKKELE